MPFRLALRGGGAALPEQRRRPRQRVNSLTSVTGAPPVPSSVEAGVTVNMRRLVMGHTAFIVAHRFSAVRDAELIVVPGQGRMAEMGTGEQLLERGGLAARALAAPGE
jgi:hypothetical protein